MMSLSIGDLIELKVLEVAYHLAILEYGISKNNSNGIYQIDDCAPFVVYKEEVPANRIVVKVQTNVGDLNLGPFKTSGSSSFN
jgi:hypothetical protein